MARRRASAARQLFLVLFFVAFGGGGFAANGCSSSSGGATPADAGTGDAGDVSDASADEGGADAAPEDPNPTLLSKTGLYDDFASKRVAPGIVEFAPKNKLWSDGAEKRRWIRLPAGAKIDTSDMDHWKFPVGTKFFKEFALDGKRLETRLIWHRADTGKLENDYFAGAFVWRDDESEAELTVDVANDLRGTDHDAPAQKQCWACHLGDPGHGLGFSAVGLSYGAAGGAGMPTLADVANMGWLSNPPPAGADYSPPGDAAASAALGYLHANCGHCHNENGLAWPDTQMVLRLGVAERDPAATHIYQTTVGVPLSRWRHAGFTNRITAGDPSTSGLLYRDGVRDAPDAGTRDQMPPLATEHTDPNGLQLVTTWIAGL